MAARANWHVCGESAGRIRPDRSGVGGIGVAKQNEELFLPHVPIRSCCRAVRRILFVQRVRDEAHRFAITAHRARRDKQGVASKWDGSPGYRPKRRKALLVHFGNIEAIRQASLDRNAGSGWHQPGSCGSAQGALSIERRRRASLLSFLAWEVFQKWCFVKIIGLPGSARKIPHLFQTRCCVALEISLIVANRLRTSLRSPRRCAIHHEFEGRSDEADWKGVKSLNDDVRRLRVRSLRYEVGPS